MSVEDQLILHSFFMNKVIYDKLTDKLYGVRSGVMDMIIDTLANYNNVFQFKEPTGLDMMETSFRAAAVTYEMREGVRGAYVYRDLEDRTGRSLASLSTDTLLDIYKHMIEEG